MLTLRDDLGYMQAAAADAISILGNANLQELERNREKQAALCYLIIVVGESANRVRHRQEHVNYPAIDWDGPINMRNVLVHRHHSVKLDRVFDVITNRFPQLITAINLILLDLP